MSGCQGLWGLERGFSKGLQEGLHSGLQWTCPGSSSGTPEPGSSASQHLLPQPRDPLARVLTPPALCSACTQVVLCRELALGRHAPALPTAPQSFPPKRTGRLPFPWATLWGFVVLRLPFRHSGLLDTETSSVCVCLSFPPMRVCISSSLRFPPFSVPSPWRSPKGRPFRRKPTSQGGPQGVKWCQVRPDRQTPWHQPPSVSSSPSCAYFCPCEAIRASDVWRTAARPSPCRALLAAAPAARSFSHPPAPSPNAPPAELSTPALLQVALPC